MFRRIIVILMIGLVAWGYQAIRPPPPKLCGSPGGPPVTAPRVKLRDGRHLAYNDVGVPKYNAKYKIICAHGLGSSRLDTAMVPKELLEEMGVYVVFFDRPGYGESDPDPNRTVKSIALDVEELADHLEFGPKFYIIGYSMGGQTVWGCLKYIPHRLAGATLVAPVVNYWWPGFPANLSTEAYYEQYASDQWALRVAHYIPWLTYWWNTQKWFPGSSVASGKGKFSRQDMELLTKLFANQIPVNGGYATQQGHFESLYRDMIVAFRSWEFDPMDLNNPFPNQEGSVHLWQGDEDGVIPVSLQRYVAGKLSWIKYHELPGAGHIFSIEKKMSEAIFKTLVLGEKQDVADN